VDLASGRCCGAQASVHWHHPALGLIPASEFVPIAAEVGLVTALGHWSIQQACLAMAGWRARGCEPAPDSVSIQLFPAQLAAGAHLREQINAALRMHDLEPGCLQIEISERELMLNPAGVGPVLTGLRGAGVRLAIGDFGVGHSPLSALRSFPVDAVKIDRSFLADLPGNHASLAVVTATITMIHNLGARSVAQGVEDATQLAVLQSLGCQFAQGPYFGEPRSASHFAEGMRVSGTESGQSALLPTAVLARNP
jgi:EAL domain-containing protein (putative c-di-GMP-specific phosphodiesterase class I)